MARRRQRRRGPLNFFHEETFIDARLVRHHGGYPRKSGLTAFAMRPP